MGTKRKPGFAMSANRPESHLSRRPRVHVSTLACEQWHKHVESGTSLRAVGSSIRAGVPTHRTPARFFSLSRFSLPSSGS
jgi:hypothetical protein